jgi:hypothetical protein
MCGKNFDETKYPLRELLKLRNDKRYSNTCLAKGNLLALGYHVLKNGCCICFGFVTIGV